MEPLLEKCFVLAQEALSGARVAGGELDRIILVGGPTQTPILREMLGSRFGAPVDFSTDPMTVVGRGAAIYASTLERVKREPAPQTAGRNDGDRVTLKLAYEPVSAELQCTVAGRIMSPKLEVEIKIEAEGGLWTSGWIKPDEGFFEIPVSLKEGSITTFWVYARDGQGRLLDTDTTEFKVRHGLVPSAPPLPHTLSVEVLNPGGKSELDPIFLKGTPLPAEKKVKYRAMHALVPDNPESDLAIKLSGKANFAKIPKRMNGSEMSCYLILASGDPFRKDQKSALRRQPASLVFGEFLSFDKKGPPNAGFSHRQVSLETDDRTFWPEHSQKSPAKSRKTPVFWRRASETEEQNHCVLM